MYPVSFPRPKIERGGMARQIPLDIPFFFIKKFSSIYRWQIKKKSRIFPTGFRFDVQQPDRVYCDTKNGYFRTTNVIHRTRVGPIDNNSHGDRLKIPIICPTPSTHHFINACRHVVLLTIQTQFDSHRRHCYHTFICTLNL